MASAGTFNFRTSTSVPGCVASAGAAAFAPSPSFSFSASFGTTVSADQTNEQTNGWSEECVTVSDTAEIELLHEAEERLDELIVEDGVHVLALRCGELPLGLVPGDQHLPRVSSEA